MNKIRPLLQRASVRNMVGAPRATFTMARVLKGKLVVIVILPEGVLGKDATTLIGQVVLARLWAAVQARSGRTFYIAAVHLPDRSIGAGHTGSGGGHPQGLTGALRHTKGGD